MFSSRSLKVSSPRFASLRHFQLICVCGVKVCSSFIGLPCSCPVFPPLAEKTVFLPFQILASFMEDEINCRCLGLFVGSVFCWYQDHSGWMTVALEHCLKCGRVMPPAWIWFLRMALASPGLLGFQIRFGIACSSSVCRKHHGSFDRDHLELVDCLGQYGRFYSSNFSHPVARTVFPWLCILFNVLD